MEEIDFRASGEGNLPAVAVIVREPVVSLILADSNRTIISKIFPNPQIISESLVAMDNIEAHEMVFRWSIAHLSGVENLAALTMSVAAVHEGQLYLIIASDGGRPNGISDEVINSVRSFRFL